MAGRPNLPVALDAGTARRVARSFLVVRLARGGLLLVFLAVALAGVEARDWPRAVSVTIGLAMLGVAGGLVAGYRRYARDARDARDAERRTTPRRRDA